jgi:hypothetical protein
MVGIRAPVYVEREVGPPSRRVAKLQIVTIDMLFQRHPIDLPGMLDPPEVGRPAVQTQPKKSRKRVEGQGEFLFPISGDLSPSTHTVEKRTNRSIREVDIEVMRPVRGGKSKP